VFIDPAYRRVPTSLILRRGSFPHLSRLLFLIRLIPFLLVAEQVPPCSLPVGSVTFSATDSTLRHYEAFSPSSFSLSHHEQSPTWLGPGFQQFL
jgi:hypothetical protein